MDADRARNSQPDAMVDDRSRAFLVAARTATLATIAPSGRPRLVPICFVVGEDDPAGRVRIYSALDDKPKVIADPHGLARVRDVLARPEATLLIDRWSEDWDRLAWLRVEASVDLLEPGAGGDAGDHGRERVHAIAALRAKYPQYARHRLEDRPLLLFTVERIVWWASRPDEDG